MDFSTDPAYQQLSMYIARGWALVPLHDVTAGHCSCRDGGACRSAGKHPRSGREWQRPEYLVRDVAGLARAAERFGPSCNWGLATGLISGVWALDYDPKNVEVAQALEVAALLRACWAAATWVQRTGSGGLHFVFALPDDFVPNNGAGTLPRGFDVRGARRGEAGGGQIVLAPSVSGTGRYEVLADRPPQLAPAVVTEAVRPVAPRARTAAPRLQPLDAGQASKYVVAAVEGVVRQLRSAPDGTRNNTAIRTAYRALELMNTGLVGREAVWAAWWEAGKAHPTAHVPDAELLGVWGRAEREIGDRPADLSGVGGPSGWMGGDVISFGAAPSVPLQGGGPGAAGGASGYPQGAHGAVDNGVAGNASGVASQVTGGNAWALPGPPGSPEAVDALAAKLLDIDQLRNVVPPQPLVNGVIDLDTTAWIIGEPGTYKSFLTLDLAAHVGLGRPWRGHDVHQGDVIYIVAEGARGMRLRVDAWEREHGPMKGVRFLPEPVQAGEPDWRTLVMLCQRLQPALVVIDTQARVTLGLEENSNTDMGRYIAAVDDIRRHTGACVLTVHHTGRNGKNARGASALDGAQDAELRIEVPSGAAAYTIELHMDKQKDQARGEPMVIRLKRSEGGTDERTGRDLSSLVVDHNAVPMPGEPSDGMSVTMRRTLALFKLIDRHYARGEGGTRADIRTLFMGLPEIAEVKTPSTRRAAWADAWGELVSRGRVVRFGDRFKVFAPPDGSVDGLLAVNDGSPEDVAPDGWMIHWPESDKAMREAERKVK